MTQLIKTIMGNTIAQIFIAGLMNLAWTFLGNMLKSHNKEVVEKLTSRIKVSLSAAA